MVDDDDSYRGYWESVDGKGNLAYDPEDYDAGDFKVGQRIRLTKETEPVKHVGAVGRVIKVETEAPDNEDKGAFSRDLIYPITVWLDVFGKQTPAEREGKLGLPVSAREVERV